MNIGIDARLLERKITGIGRFLKLILNELPEIDRENKYFLFSYEKLKQPSEFYTNIPTVKSSIPQKLFSPVWNNFILPGFLKKHNIDLFFSVNQIIPLVKVKNCKYVSVVHDVIYKADKSFLPALYRMYLQLFAHFSVKSSDMILTVSQYSKQDILKHYNIGEDKVRVVYAAAERAFYQMNLSENEKREIRYMFNLPEKFVLYVGMIENRKNIMGILQIADEVYNRNKEIGFLIIGKIGHGGEKLYAEILKRKNVVHVLGVEDLVLKKLFNSASVFLFPSLYEGFGFPPLEAMQSGLPVISSDHTSLKEIIGNGGLLHDPFDHNAFVLDIIKLTSDPVFHAEYEKKGIERAKAFDITFTTREIVKSFNELGCVNH